MKRLFLVLVLLLSSRSAFAQSPGFFGNWDYPPNGATLSISAGQVYLAGWSLNCTARQQGTSIQVFYQGDDGQQVTLGSDTWTGTGLRAVWHQPRPDVRAANESLCNALPDGLGVGVYVTGLPLGTRYYLIYTYDSSNWFVYHAQMKLLTIVP